MSRDESIITPQDTFSSSLIEIMSDKNSIIVKNSCYNDDFSEIMKDEGFSWEYGVWSKYIYCPLESTPDRMAEIGHELLRNGFIIKVEDISVRGLAISGEYEPEIKRWIDRYYDGKRAWFEINWIGRDESIYTEARRIKGAKWSKPSVIVPPEEYSEILDFAKIHGFMMTPGAKFLCKFGKIAEKAILTCTPIPSIFRGD